MNPARKYYWLPALSLLWCLPNFAETIYKSIDDNGVVSFSDTLPADEAPVDIIEIARSAPPPSALTEQRLEDMRETTDRMAADRMAREERRTELRQLGTRKYADTSSQDMIEYYDPPIIYTGGYQQSPGRHWRHANRATHPITRPPLLAPKLYHRSDFDYPASLIRKSYDPKVRAALR